MPECLEESVLHQSLCSREEAMDISRKRVLRNGRALHMEVRS